jgi:hypothetical protein
MLVDSNRGSITKLKLLETFGRIESRNRVNARLLRIREYVFLGNGKVNEML